MNRLFSSLLTQVDEEDDEHARLCLAMKKKSRFMNDAIHRPAAL